jgi:adaptin ear-binding coat-associated protein 1/2
LSLVRAETWPLTKPLQCVSLRIERRGDVLLLIFTYTVDGQKGSKLFALCSIDIVNKAQHKLEHYVEAVVDSTRYFVIRVTDEKAGREALIGLGFRDREEAGDFRAALAKYESDIQQGR